MGPLAYGSAARAVAYNKVVWPDVRGGDDAGVVKLVEDEPDEVPDPEGEVEYWNEGAKVGTALCSSMGGKERLS